MLERHDLVQQVQRLRARRHIASLELGDAPGQLRRCVLQRVHQRRRPPPVAPALVRLLGQALLCVCQIRLHRLDLPHQRRDVLDLDVLLVVPAEMRERPCQQLIEARVLKPPPPDVVRIMLVIVCMISSDPGPLMPPLLVGTRVVRSRASRLFRKD